MKQIKIYSIGPIESLEKCPYCLTLYKSEMSFIMVLKGLQIDLIKPAEITLTFPQLTYVVNE